MSVMNGFRTELINKILGFSPHIIVKPYDKRINKEDIKLLYSQGALFISYGNDLSILKNELERISNEIDSIINE